MLVQAADECLRVLVFCLEEAGTSTSPPQIPKADGPPPTNQLPKLAKVFRLDSTLLSSRLVILSLLPLREHNIRID